MKTAGWLACFSMLLALVPARAWTPQPADVWEDGSVLMAPEFGINAPHTYVDWATVARAAMDTWNNVLQRVQLVPASETGDPWYDNGRNELFFDKTFYGESFGSGVLAVAIVTTDRGKRVEADVVFNASQPWAVYTGELLEAADFRRVTVHELGHVLGLDHPDEAGQELEAIMNSVVTNRDSLSADDVAGIRALYDAASTEPPVILLPPEAVSAEQGASAELFVLAGGRGPYRYTWMKDGVPLPNGSGPWLLLEDAGLDDAGHYSVRVSNGIASVTSESALVTVTPATKPQVQISSAAELTLTAGQSRTLLASVTPSNSPSLRLQWSKDGVAIAGATTESLLIDRAQFSTAGSYTLAATNGAGTATSSPVVLKVLPPEPPQFLVEPQRVFYGRGSWATLDANGTGSEPLTYVWKKDGVAVPGATSRTLELYDFNEAKAGSYTLTMQNPFGTATSLPIRVDLGSTATPVAPLILQHPESVAEFSGARLEFLVGATGSDLQYQWFRDGVPLQDDPAFTRYSGTRSQKLGIWEATAAEAGTYTVEIRNLLGAVVSNPIQLTILTAAAPLIVTQPGARRVAVGAEVKLSVQVVRWFTDYWQEPRSAGYQYQWYKDGTAIPGATNTELSFTATLEHSGRYFVRIVSAGGTTDSKTVDVTAAEGATPLIPVYPSDKLLDSSDSEALRLFAVEMEVNRRTALRIGNGDGAVIVLESASGPAVDGVTPGTYALTVTRGDLSETARFTIGFIPPTPPVIAREIGDRVAEPGQSVSISARSYQQGRVTYQWTKNGVAIPGATGSSVYVPSFSASDAGVYRMTVTGDAGSVTTGDIVVSSRQEAVPAIAVQPTSVTTVAGQTVIVRVTAAGTDLSYQWFKDGIAISGATAASLQLDNAGTGDTGSYTVRVANSAGSTASRGANVIVLSLQRPPEFLFQPQDQTVTLGGNTTFIAAATGGPLPDRYQWFKDGVPISGAIDPEFNLTAAGVEDAGTYTVVAYNANGERTSAPAVLSVDPKGRLVNLAARARVGRGGDVLIAGFVVHGSQPRSVLVRGIGDQLSEFDVGGVLRNPVLKLFDSASKLLATSDDWMDEDVTRLRAAEAETGAFPMRVYSQDAALVATLPPGNYSAQLSGMVNTTGVGMIEIYELGRPSADRLINLSCRSYVGTGDQVLIPGLSIRGAAPRKVLVRAIGPTLEAFGVAGALGDPRLTVYQGDVAIATNDDWETQDDAAAVAVATRSVGAFPLASGSKDAAVVLELAPGGYTIHASGANETTGVALVEVYELP